MNALSKTMRTVNTLTDDNSAGAQKSNFFFQSDSVALGGVLLFVLHRLRLTNMLPARLGSVQIL